MNTIARTDTSIVGRWWWTVDRWLLVMVASLAFFGAVLSLAASPAVAERIGLDTYHFVARQLVFLPVALMTMLGVSLLSARGVRRLALFVTVSAVILMVLTLIIGVEVKGATRWIRLGGFAIQPSEFVKPGFAVLAAWLFSQRRLDDRFPGYALATGLYLGIVALLALQPDIGMTFAVSAVWFVQFFLAGLPLMIVVVLGVALLASTVGAYFVFDHVQARVDQFLDPSSGGGYQVTRSLEALRNGGLFGRGPGEGRIKEVLPDAHADFILAVAGEEFGLIVCLVLVILFAGIVLRGISRAFQDDDLFIMLGVAGLMVQFALQAIINMASTLNMMPPKGMTLPFISYGGSSTLAMGIGMGMALALTRTRPGARRLS
ncbi:MAG: cell division protein FtsW [Rhodospirillales bacterium]|jgi:cell division protein FtsW|nr:cell division protein FtsW [Rhodospirillales bacterium]MBT4040365.1 cell division protein FtsW [Rhodospirillales bacterium]MBT4625993.1 cell division protein FtsW [Rhodospirillales bacterium]MBT5351281.1 cell division protein FtsW [Rhodospirillales bacterium]MBT5519357.1 cell division protein FtsW [Rhodospirillales bacterium]